MNAITKPGSLYGPISASEADVVVLTERYTGLIEDAKLIRYHLRHCENASLREFAAFDEILKALGIYDEVLEPVKQPNDY